MASIAARTAGMRLDKNMTRKFVPHDPTETHIFEPGHPPVVVDVEIYDDFLGPGPDHAVSSDSPTATGTSSARAEAIPGQNISMTREHSLSREFKEWPAGEPGAVASTT
jgi:hypothetical protein